MSEQPPLPFREFVLKLHSRCDLACDHCYVYEHADQSWRGRPMTPSAEVLAATAARITEHARAHGLPRVGVVLHGGEPLLAGPRLIRAAAGILRAPLEAAGIALDLRLHTNGVLLDEPMCELLLELGIAVGVSLDGDRESHDRHRRYADGRGSHDRTLRALALLRRPRYRPVYAGLLCTIDVRNDPVAVYRALAAQEPPRIDLLLPHATWDEPPLRPGGARHPYADWLLAVRREWVRDGRPMGVRTFEALESTLRGGPSTTESLGLDPVDLLVIETDGTLEQADSLKTAYDGAPATGYDVRRHPLDVAARHPGVRARQTGLAGLSATCRACPVVGSCGGGLYAHRYRSPGTGGADGAGGADDAGAGGFGNPSVYCDDLFALVRGVEAELQEPELREPELQEPEPRQRATRFAAASADGAPADADLVAAVARGRGEPEAVRALAEAQSDISLALVALVLREAARRAPERTGPLAALFDALEAAAPDALEAAVAHPYTRVWAVAALRQEGQDPGGLAELAAAALLAAPEGALPADAGVEVPLRGGLLRLPGVGVLRPPGGVAGAGATVTVARGRPDGDWSPLRPLDAPGLRLLLDDADPLRDVFEHPVAERADAAEYAAWSAELAAAWSWLGAELPEYASELAAGLRVVTSLRPDPGGGLRSAGARHAFGAVGIARPGDPETLAGLLVHEFQHVKLAALLDLVDLLETPAPSPDGAGGVPLLPVAWRPDPRPPEAVLQGVYAHLAVVAHARALARTRPSTRPSARAAADRWSAAVEDASGRLLGCGLLTPAGRAVVEGVLGALNSY